MIFRCSPIGYLWITTLIRIQLENNSKLTVYSARCWNDFFKSIQTLGKVCFRGRPNIDDQRTILVADAMKHNQSINETIMNDGQIVDEGSRTFSWMLAFNQVLPRLHLFNNQIIDEDEIASIDGL
jgi:hypothetical protein